MKCLVCEGHGGWTTDSMFPGCPPHFDRCEHCNGTGREPGIERLGEVDLDSLVGLPE